MKQLLSKLLISGVAVGVVPIRTFRPDIKVDSTTAILLVVAISPWLSALKGVEALGVKLDYRHEEKDRPNDGLTEPIHASPALSQQTLEQKALAQRGTSVIYADNYFARLVKLTPIESIAFFIVISSLFRSTPTRAGVALEWSIFGLVLTPLFLWKIGVRKKSQTVAMTLAFCVWIFAICGPFTTLPWYQSWYGGIVLALFMSALPILT